VKDWDSSRFGVMVIEEMATSMRPELVAANSGWKSMPSMLVVMPTRLAASLTMSTSKPSKVPLSFLYSKGGLLG
jgi:hypothetical protein